MSDAVGSDVPEPEIVSELVGAAEAHVADGVPACQVAIARHGEVVWTRTFGDAPDGARFCVFSATKPIVASAVWLLIGEGRLDTAARVADYVPEFATNGKEVVSVEQVLLHTAGFPNAPMSSVRGADPAYRRERFGQWELQWEPGSRFEYHATSAHWVLAELIDRLTGSDFREFVEARVTAPLGLGRRVGIPIGEQGDLMPMVPIGDGPHADEITLKFSLQLNEPEVRAAGIPGGGAFATAAELARFYQALLRNPDGLWKPDVLADATANVRNRFPDPMMGVACNRTIGLVVAGDDGKHILRQGMFGRDNSPGTFGHAGANTQVGWADPATGWSFAYLNNAVDADPLAAARRGNRISTIASKLR